MTRWLDLDRIYDLKVGDHSRTRLGRCAKKTYLKERTTFFGFRVNSTVDAGTIQPDHEDDAL